MSTRSRPERDGGVGLAHPTVVPENFDPETGTVRESADGDCVDG